MIGEAVSSKDTSYQMTVMQYLICTDPSLGIPSLVEEPSIAHGLICLQNKFYKYDYLIINIIIY